MEERFELLNDGPAPKEFQDREREKQKKLFSGMDAKRGQQDLFKTDGESDDRERVQDVRSNPAS